MPLIECHLCQAVLPTIYTLSLIWKPSDKTGIVISVLSVVGPERLNIQIPKLRWFKFCHFHSCLWNVSDGLSYKELDIYWILLILVHCGWKRAFLVNVSNCGTSLSMLLYLKSFAPEVMGMCLATPEVFSFVGGKQDSPMQFSPYKGPLEHFPPPPTRVWLVELLMNFSLLFSSVTQSCPTLCDLMGCSIPGFPVHHQLLELAQTHVHWVGDAIQPSRPLSSPSPPALIFPGIRVLSNVSVLCIRWPKYWSFSFSISPSNEYSSLLDQWIQRLHASAKGRCRPKQFTLENTYQVGILAL